MATQCGHLAVVKVLLEAGTDANKASNTGIMPSEVAARFDHLAVVKALLGSGADIHKTHSDGNMVLL